MVHGRSHLASHLLGRQLRGGLVLHRPFVAEFCCEGGTVMNNPGLTGTPAFAAEYSKVYNDGKLLAIADEEGYVSIVDTAGPLPTEMSDEFGPNKPRAQWLAHRNAVFDIAWCNGDTQMLTASGDQTVSLWDTGHADLIASFRGHSGSVKTVSPMPASHCVFASGARDGALMVWDSRAPSCPDGATGDSFHAPVIKIQDAHAPSGKQKRRRTPLQGRTRPSVTSLTFLQGDGNQLATGGVDGVVKFWDLRQSTAASSEAAPGLELERLCDAGVPPISQKQHGITSLTLHPQGSQLLVSLTGGHHFIYDPLRPQIGPTRWFGGHTVASFYVKAAWSPDGSHIISGSTDRNVYIWQVDAPDGASPYVLPGHQGEVTAVAWCPSDFHQIATTADDASLKVWNIQRRQPEEQADDGAPRHPWVYPWQQQQQVAAAAAAAAAYGDVGQTPRSGTPLAAGFGSASASAGRLADASPWVPSPGSGIAGASGSSAAMLAGLRSGVPAGDDGPQGAARPTGVPPSAQQQAQQQQQQGEENVETNHAAPASAAQQARQTGGHAPGSAQAQRVYHTPSAAHAAAAGGTGSPGGHAGATRTGAGAGTSGRPVARRMADLLNAAPSTRRTVRQQSIQGFLRSPAPALACGQGKGTAGGGTGPVGSPHALAASSRDLGIKRGAPLPGLGGSALPSPRAKRLRTTFEVAGRTAAATGVEGTGPASGSIADSAIGRQGAAVAAQLEPSPEQGVAAAAAAAAGGGHSMASKGAGLCMERQPSSNENLELGNVQVA